MIWQLQCSNFIIYWTVKTFTIWEKKLCSPTASKNRKLESRHIQMLNNILLDRIQKNNHNEHMERFSGNIGNIRRIWRHSAVHLLFPMGILATYYSNVWSIRLQNIQVFLSALFFTIDNGNFSKLFYFLYYSKDKFLHW